MTSIYKKFLLLYYVPSYMITISSWFFYLLPSTSYPARTALLMTAFLLLIQIYNSVVNDTPNSNGRLSLTNNLILAKTQLYKFKCLCVCLSVHY